MFGVWGSEVRISGFGINPKTAEVEGSGFRVKSSGFKDWG